MSKKFFSYSKNTPVIIGSAKKKVQ
jgi:hypothetical protein